MSLPATGLPCRPEPQSPRARSFNATRAFRHVERLVYPRRVGTVQERKAARYVARTFAASGLRCRRESFPVPLVSGEIGARILLAACLALVLLGASWSAHAPLVASGAWGLAIPLLNGPWKGLRRYGNAWPTRLRSRNLIAYHPSIRARRDAPARVVFMAHYDTKSQVLPTGVRVGLVIAATSLCLLLALTGLAVATGLLPLMPARTVSLAAAAIALMLIILAANITGNRSPGALDNATGLGTLLELARTWRPHPDAPVEALFVATGSEELGLVGARDLLRRHEAWWRAKPTLLINLDSVGAGARLYLAGEPGALELTAQTADALAIPWARLRALGAGMDHEPFAARGLAAVSILGDVVGRSLDLHSPRDTLARVDPEALHRAGTLAAALAWAWAARHNAEANAVARALPA